MINGNVNEFVSGLYYGDERWFLLNNKKYFIQGWVENDKFTLILDQPYANSTQNYPVWSKTLPLDKKKRCCRKLFEYTAFQRQNILGSRKRN